MLGIYWPNLVGNLCTYIKYVYVCLCWCTCPALAHREMEVKGSLYCRHVFHISVIHYQVLAIRHGPSRIRQPTAAGCLQKFFSWPFHEETLCITYFLCVLSCLYRNGNALENYLGISAFKIGLKPIK